MVQFPNIFFKFNSYSIDDSDAAGLLYGVLDVLLSYRDIQVVLVGHADDRGTRTYNLALAPTFKDMRTVYEQETGQGRPFYMSRRFRGSLIAGVATIAAVHYGVDFSPETIINISENLERVISAVTAIYGFVMILVGTVKRK